MLNKSSLSQAGYAEKSHCLGCIRIHSLENKTGWRNKSVAWVEHFGHSTYLVFKGTERHSQPLMVRDNG